MKPFNSVIIPVFVVLASIQCYGQSLTITATSFEAPGSKVEDVSLKGSKVIKVTATGNNDPTAILKGLEFRNGTIEIELSGAPAIGSDSTNRGFVGVAFRIQPRRDTLVYEAMYIRPTNGRSTDQLRRNHSVQYVSEPKYTWFRLRKEFPGVYESYADMAPGEWVKVKIVVKGKQAKLYLHGAAQPCLIVNDLKLGESSGSIALFTNPGVDSYYRNLKVTKSN